MAAVKRYLLLAVLVGCGADAPTTVPADFKPGPTCIIYSTAPATTVEGCPGGVIVDLGTFVPAP